MGFTPSSFPPTQTCEHKWVFLRQEYKDSYNKKVDVFYCEKCAEYLEKVIWQGRPW